MSDVTLVLLYSIFSGLVLITNGIVVIVVVKSRQLHLPTLWNIAFMAAWDFTLGLYFLLFVVPSKMIDDFAFSEKLKPFSSILLLLITNQNILNIVVALVDRYISICWPLHYPRLMSSRRFALAVASVFAINVARMCLVVLPNGDTKYYPDLGLCISANGLVAKYSTFAMIVASSVLIVSLLVTVLVELGKKRKMYTAKNRTSTQFTLTVCLSTIVFIASFLPVGVTVVLGGIFGEEKIPKFLVKFDLICILSNSLWNVYIYTFTYKPFKDAFLRMFCPSIFRERARREIQLDYIKQLRETNF